MNITPYRMEQLLRVDGFAADMDSTTISRYQPGGDIHRSLSSTYGSAAANRVASAASSGSRANVTSVMSSVRNGPATGSSSTFVNFMQQIKTDPLQAPVAAAMGQGSSGPGLGGNTTGKVIKGIATIGILALVLYGANTFARLKGK